MACEVLKTSPESPGKFVYHLVKIDKTSLCHLFISNILQYFKLIRSCNMTVVGYLTW